MSPTMAFTTLGCRLNQAESDAMGEELAQRGYATAAADEEPDVVVVNTCTVTREATKASRSAIRRAARAHPGSTLVVTGCYAVSDRAEVEAIEGVDAIVTNDEKEGFLEALGRRPATRPLLQIGMPRGTAPAVEPRRVRANVKVQTGCDEWCSFCIIPTTRGPLRSVPEHELVARARTAVAAGARELVLTGVHLGKFGHDEGGDERRLVGLLRSLLAIEGVVRIRLSSILSRHLTEEVVSLIASEPRICRHLHVPLQSGDDGVLDAMHRPYRSDEYVAAVERARDAIEGLALATDIIVGFPTETDDAFARTVEVVRRVGFSKLHVFRYSARPGTAAASLGGGVPVEVAKARSKHLIEVGNEIRARFLQDHVGRVLEVLVEDERVVDRVTVSSGQTSDHVRVWFEGSGSFGRMVGVIGERMRADGIEGRMSTGGARG